MQKFDASQLKTFENLVMFTQKELRQVMAKYLKSRYNKVVATKKYIYALGDIPIALVAHMDTVFKNPPSEIFYDTNKNVIWGDDGLGADDRAGIFAIINIIESGYRPCVILTTDEEIGGVGARALAKIPCPFPNLKYMIELDRQGSNDCVFYQLDNPSFVDYIESFGFVEQWGTYSDICELAPAWKTCAVNLSIGYIDEHSLSERLYVGYFLKTIERVKVMLSQKNIPDYAYREMTYGQFIKNMYGTSWTADDSSNTEYFHCKKCNTLYSEYEVFPVKGLDGKTVYYCPDCIVDKVEWCDHCGEAYETDGVEGYGCPDCRRTGGEESKNV